MSNECRWCGPKVRIYWANNHHRVAGSFLPFTLVFQEWLGREAQEVLSGSITRPTEFIVII